MSISLPNARNTFLPYPPTDIKDSVVKKYLDDLRHELELMLVKQFDNTYRVSQDIKYVYFILPDDAIYTGADKIGRIYVTVTGTIVEVNASVKTAPSGTSIICDINKNGSTIWSTQANRIIIADGSNTGTQTTFDTTTVTSGDYFTIDVDQVGSTTPGAKLTVRLALQP